jgi:hypothetical protein
MMSRQLMHRKDGFHRLWSVALSGHDAAPNFTLQEFGIQLP